jgi:hypothetical protein
MLLSEVLAESGKPLVLKIDNKSAIDLIKNSVHHERSKHIRTRYHFVPGCAAEGRVEIQFVGTNDQLADILTMSPPRIRFLEMKEKIRAAEIK